MAQPATTQPANTEAPSPAAPPKIATARKGFDLALLAPVGGVDYRTYGHVTYAMFRDPDGDHAAILAKFGIDKARFDAANQAFGERMKQDKSFAMVEMFGAYFAETADGPYAALGRDVAQSVLDQAPLKEAEPMPEEKFREIQIYYARKATVAGTELAKQDEVLRPYHVTFNDFNILGAWFSRRLALQRPALSPEQEAQMDAARSASAQSEPERERPEWGGLWHFSWKMLKRTDKEMKVVEQSRDICIKADMTADTLPLMPKPEGVKCAMSDAIHFYESGISIRAQCDLGGIGTFWGVELTPQDDGESFAGQISYNEMYEGDQDMAQPTTDVVVKRIGDCP